MSVSEWHFLEINPDDTPDSSNCCACVTENNIWYDTFFCYYDTVRKEWFTICPVKIGSPEYCVRNLKPPVLMWAYCDAPFSQ